MLLILLPDNCYNSLKSVWYDNTPLAQRNTSYHFEDVDWRGLCVYGMTSGINTQITSKWTDIMKENSLFSVRKLWSILPLSWRRPLSYRNQSIDLRSKSMDWFLYHKGLRHERVKLGKCASQIIHIHQITYIRWQLKKIFHYVSSTKSTMD